MSKLLRLISNKFKASRQATQSSAARRLLRGAFWNVLAVIVARFAVLGITIVVARLIGQEAFGKYSIVYSTLSMLGAFAGVGLGITAIKYISELKTKDVEGLSGILMLTRRIAIASAAAFAIVTYLFAGPLATGVFRTPDLKELIAYASLAVFFTALDAYNHAVIVGFEAAKKSALGALLGSVVAIPVSIGMAAVFGLTGAVIGLWISALINCATSQVIVARILRAAGVRKVAKPIDWQPIFRFALPAFVAGLFAPISHWICYALLAQSHPGHKEVALLGVALQWFQAMLLLPSVAARSILPVLSDFLGQKHTKQFFRMLMATAIASVAIMLPLALLIAVLAPTIMQLYGASFESGWQALGVAAIAAVFAACCIPAGQGLAAKNRMWMGLTLNAAWALSYVVFAWLLVDIGAFGICIALACAYAIHMLWLYGGATVMYRHESKLL